MDRKGVTLMEITACILILIVLASISLGVFNNIVNSARLNLCRQNQIIIMNALKLYIYQNNTVPASLSKLPAKYCDFAIASLKKNEPRALAMRKVYLALVKMSEGDDACAGGEAFTKDYITNPKVFKCPVSSGTGRSYAYNDTLVTGAGVIDQFKWLETNDYPIICDSTVDKFAANDAAGGNGDITAGLATRHKYRTYAIAIATGSKTSRIIDSGANWSTPKKKWYHIAGQ